MKIVPITIAVLISFINLFTQTDKPCLFLASTSQTKSICSDYKWEKESVIDYNDYSQKFSQFKARNKDNAYAGYGGTFVSSNESVIVVQFKTKIPGFNCSRIGYAFIKGKTMESCLKQLSSRITENPTQYEIKPTIVFEWTGKGSSIGQKDPNAPVTSGTSPKPNPTSDGSQAADNSNNSASNTPSSCPTYGFKTGIPSIYCQSFEWWAISQKTLSADNNGSVKLRGGPEAVSFTIQYRKEGSNTWLDTKLQTALLNQYSISGLDACTKYEVRLITACDNGATSLPTSIVRFTTGCPTPKGFSIENVTTTSAGMNGGIESFSTFTCNSIGNLYRVYEFKTGSGPWDEMICSGACVISGLIPGTTYRVRSRYKFGNNIYSEYTNEKSFTTRK